jgi:octaprenyl-diphosphate synthase
MKPQNKLLDIQKPIHAEMRVFEKKFQDSMRSKAPLLDRIMSFIVRRKGKQMRPMFVLLMARLCGEIQESTYRGASLIELLHTATLVHDDVVDDAEYRRGFFSINALWKNKIAVLVGDYLLSKGLLLAVENKDFGLLEIVSKAVKEMSEGELLQVEKARKLDISEEIYFEIIRQKTATLISSCCEVGAYSTGASPENLKQAAFFGEKVGLAFQIKDDLFDYGSEEIGKPRGIDIQEKKLTLPLIHSLNQSSWMEKRKVIKWVKGANRNRENIHRVIAFVREKGGIDYSKKVMDRFKNEALDILMGFPENECREALKALVEFTIERKR